MKKSMLMYIGLVLMTVLGLLLGIKLITTESHTAYLTDEEMLCLYVEDRFEDDGETHTYEVSIIEYEKDEYEIEYISYFAYEDGCPCEIGKVKKIELLGRYGY